MTLRSQTAMPSARQSEQATISEERRREFLALLFLCAGLLGALHVEIVHTGWRIGRSLPVGRGDLLWLGLCLAVGLGWALRRVDVPPLSHKRRLVLLALLSAPLALHLACLGGLTSPWWGWACGSLLAGLAGAEAAVLVRIFQRFDLQGGAWFEPSWLLWGLLSLALPTALLPYFGPLPVCASLAALLALWLRWASKADARRFGAGWIGGLPWLGLFFIPGWFASDPGFLPIASAKVQGQTFYLQTERRVDLLRVSGPGGWFLSMEAHRWAEALIHPALAQMQGPARVLLLGGEEGVALREILRLPAVAKVEQIAWNASRLRFFAQNPLLRRLHGDSFLDPRLHLTEAKGLPDLLQKLARLPRAFSAIVLAFDEETTPQLLLSVQTLSIFRALRPLLLPRGRLAISVGLLPGRDPRPVACPLASLRHLGFSAEPLRVPGLDATLGFLLASPSALPRPSLPLGLRYLAPELLPALYAFPADLRPERVPLSACPRPSLEAQRQ